jgi:hypothetical protein
VVRKTNVFAEVKPKFSRGTRLVIRPLIGMDKTTGKGDWPDDEDDDEKEAVSSLEDRN